MKNRYTIGLGVLGILFLLFFIVDSFLFTGVRPRTIHTDGFQGNYFAKNETLYKPAIIIIGGGQDGDYWSQQLANTGFVGLSLPYIRREGLPPLPENIDLAYFEDAFKWMQKQPEVDSNKIVLLGASRNAELALILGATFPNLIHGVIAYSPSAYAWSNTVLPYNSNEIKASWVYHGKEIPYIPMDKISGNETGKINTLAYWEKGLQKTSFLSQAAIPIENINGPVLLFSGKDDHVWPSTYMAELLTIRAKDHDFAYPFQNISYENAGHLISGNPEVKTEIANGKMTVNGKVYEFEFGGTMEGDFIAKQDAKKKVFKFMNDL